MVYIYTGPVAVPTTTVAIQKKMRRAGSVVGPLFVGGYMLGIQIVVSVIRQAQIKNTLK